MPAKGAQPGRRRAPGLWVYLAGLVGIAVLPMLVGAAVGIAFIVSKAEMQTQRSREQLATALAYALDAQIERLKPMMRTLARDPHGQLDASDDDRRELHARLRRLGEAFDTVFWLQGNHPDHGWIMASNLPYGTLPDGPMCEDTRALRERAEASGQPELGNLVMHPVVTHRPGAPVIVPMRQDDTPFGVLGAVVDPAVFARLLASQRIEPPEFASLIDGAGRIVARSTDNAAYLGRPVPRSLVPPPDVPVGTIFGNVLDGTPARLSFAHLPGSPGWSVVVGTPESVYRAGRIRRWKLFGIGAVGSILLGLLAAYVLARQFMRPLARVIDGAEAVAAGRPWPATGPWGGAQTREFQRLERAVRQGQERLLADAQAARRREALLSSVTESSAYAIFVKDLEGRYQLVNRAAAAALGHAPEAIIGRTDAELLPNAAEAFRASDQEVLASGEEGLFEARVTDGEGRPQVWQEAKAPWRDPRTGEIIGVVGLSRDITAELEAEAQLRESQQALQTLARRATISAMASGMAHELSQPLTAAANYLHVASGFAEREGSAALRPLHLGQEQVRRAGEILRQVRQFLRRDDTERQLSPIAELVEDAMHLALGGFDGVQPLADFSATPGLPMQLVNPVQIQQVVINLVRNACEALAERPGDNHGRIAVRVAAEEDGGVSVTVADNGPGIPAAILDTLFEPFRSTKPTGSGIGLAICRAIVESHGGRIAVEAAQGGGTWVRFTLPGSGEAEAAR